MNSNVTSRQGPAPGPGSVSMPRPLTVRRPRLVRRLLTSGETPVVLIDAPAGFGKSTVLAEWDAADGRPFAWLTLGDRHDDPVLLTASIAGALGDLFPVDDGVYAALYGSRPATLKVAVPRLLESLHHSAEPLVVALDDVHAIHDPGSLGIVGALCEGLPEGSQLALASRHQPPIRLGRLRARRSLTELTAKDLAMTEGEAASLLHGCGLRLAPESVEVLVTRTEGWPAALYLAALSLAAADDPDLAAQRFAGDERLVTEYLRDEYISSLTPEELEFLIRSSVLDEVSAELCDSVLGIEGSALTLKTLARSNALVQALDSRGQRFRYHALLREMLGSELRVLRPAEEADLHARAARWYVDRGDFDRGVPHAIAAGDAEHAGDLIWNHTAEYASTGREVTLERWLDAFTEAEIASIPTLCLVRATCELTLGDGGQVDHWTSVAAALLDASTRADREALKVVARAIRASAAAREGAVQMGKDAAAAYVLLPDPSPWRPLCRLIEGVAWQLAGDREKARLALEDGARRGAVTTPSVKCLCLAQLALLELDDDDLAAARALVEESAEITERHGIDWYPTSASVFAVAALVRARCGEADRADRDVRRSIGLLAELSDLSPWYEIETRIALARGLTVLDDISAAREQLAIAGRHMRQVPDAPVLGDWIQRAWKEADSATVDGRWPLSPAELRLLRYLPTHLTFREIADELFVSTNTVKTQARSIYGKLGVSSRAEAVACARTAGLLGTTDEPRR